LGVVTKARRGDSKRLRDEAPLLLAATDVLDHGVREDDVELPVREGQLEGVTLNVARSRKALAEARSLVQPQCGDLARPGVELLEEVERPAALVLAEGGVVGSDVEHRRLGGRRHRLHEERELAPSGTQGDCVGEAHLEGTVRCEPVIEDVVRPAGPYRLHLMTYGRPFETPLPGGGVGQASQRSDGWSWYAPRTRNGSSCCGSCSHSTPTRPSSAIASATIGSSARRSGTCTACARCGRPTVARALLRAVCGQLIEARRARAIELAIVRACGEPAPTREAIGALSPAQLRRLGLATGRASTLVRVCRTIDLEGLRAQPIDAVEARLLRERGLGPWSLGVVAMHGLGSWRHGLVGDLGLVKLCSALRGRWVELHETAELLEPYGEWAGLAGAYLMAGWGRGLVPGASADRAHFVRSRAA
jgi:3-methyladenine DNA glycosylase/8-oxoguanine DNA glycosylase